MRKMSINTSSKSVFVFSASFFNLDKITGVPMNQIITSKMEGGEKLFEGFNIELNKDKHFIRLTPLVITEKSSAIVTLVGYKDNQWNPLPGKSIYIKLVKHLEYPMRNFYSFIASTFAKQAK